MSDQDQQRKLLDAYISEGRDRVDDYRRPDLLEMACKNQALSLEHGLAFAREQSQLNEETPINPIVQGLGTIATFNVVADTGPGTNQAEAITWANPSAHSIEFGNDSYRDGVNVGFFHLFWAIDIVLFPTGDVTFTTYLDLIDKDENALMTYQADVACTGFVFTSTYTVRPTNTIPSFNGIRARIATPLPGLTVQWSFWYILGSINAVVL